MKPESQEPGTTVPASLSSVLDALERLGEGARVVGPGLEIVAFNQRLVDLLGLPRDWLRIGDPLEKLVRLEQELDAGPSSETGDRVAERIDIERRFEPYRLELESSNGSITEVRGTPLDESAFLTVYTDVTVSRRAEQALVRAKESSDETARLKSEFLANMSHEIRTPMNGVIGMTELLLDTGLDAVQREQVDTIRRSADSLLSILNDILDFSKIEAGKLDLEHVPLDVGALAEDLATLLAGRAHRKGIELVCAVPVDVPGRLLGDPTRLGQVLTNLLGNAIKFTEEGEVVLRIEVVAHRPCSSRLRFSVEDTGIGIDAKFVDRLFSPFTQADGSTTRRYGGTGLGLAISRQLVELMGGGIEAQPRETGGSRFCFELDLPIAKSAPDDSPWTEVLRGARVLVVDDNETNRRILEHYFAAWGFACSSAEDGRRAIELARMAARRREPYSLAILDHQMPEIDGSSVARILRTDVLTADIRVVILSSGLNVAGDGSHADAVLAKPVRRSRLFDTLAEVLHDKIGGTKTSAPRDVELDTAHARLSGRVLLVEDHAVNRRVALAMLERVGVDVEVAVNGREALERIARERFDVVLMDCQMPELDGFAATRELRRREASSGSAPVVVVAMTAHAMKGDREQCLAAGMDDYLSKPVKLDALHHTLGRWLPGGSGRASPAATPAASAPCEARAVPDEAAPVEAAGPVPAPIDEDALGALREMLGPELSEVVAAYVEDSERLAGDLCRASLDGDAERLATIAHQLKSSSAQLGANTLAAAAGEIERRGRCGSADSAALVGEVGSELARVRERLVTEL